MNEGFAFKRCYQPRIGEFALDAQSAHSTLDCVGVLAKYTYHAEVGDTIETPVTFSRHTPSQGSLIYTVSHDNRTFQTIL